jgi:hypothetical protein
MVNMLQYYHRSKCIEYQVDAYEGRFVLCLSTIIFKTKFAFNFFAFRHCAFMCVHMHVKKSCLNGCWLLSH